MDEPEDDPLEVAPKKRGKVPGSGRKRRDSDAKMKEVITAFHLDVVAGRAMQVSGPTGKKISRLPSISERQKSAEFLMEQIQSRPTPTVVTPDATPDLEDMRAAVGELMGLQRHAQPIVAGDDSLEPQVDKDGGIVKSITDPAAIAAFDRARSAAPKHDSRVDFECGFYALRDIQAGSGKVVYRLFNGDHQECGIKSTPALAEKWFYENTVPGQQAAKKRAAS